MEQNNQPLSAKEYALNIFLSSIPMIGLILLLLWGFSSDTNIHKKAWAKGMLIIYLIMFALFIVMIGFALGLAFLSPSIIDGLDFLDDLF